MLPDRLRANHHAADTLPRPGRDPRVVAGQWRLVVGGRRVRRTRLTVEPGATQTGRKVRS